MIGAIEAGGTKFNCAVFDDNGRILDRITIPTTNPKETLGLVRNFFNNYHNGLQGIGVGAFGPIDLNKQSKSFGFILSTPKEKWKNYDLLSALRSFIEVPIYLTTDVNAACYGEFLNGAGLNSGSLVYITVGTGIGAGGFNGQLFMGETGHPEMGHMMISQAVEDNFEGNCIYHKNCLEGLASGPAIYSRLGIKAEELAEEHSYWEIESDYLAQCVYNITLIANPEKVVLGGGVMNQKHLIHKVREKFDQRMNGYLLKEKDYIVLPELGNDAGVIGCFEMVRNKFGEVTSL